MFFPRKLRIPSVMTKKTWNTMFSLRATGVPMNCAAGRPRRGGGQWRPGAQHLEKWDGISTSLVYLGRLKLYFLGALFEKNSKSRLTMYEDDEKVRSIIVCLGLDTCTHWRARYPTKIWYGWYWTFWVSVDRCSLLCLRGQIDLRGLHTYQYIPVLSLLLQFSCTVVL